MRAAANQKPLISENVNVVRHRGRVLASRREEARSERRGDGRPCRRVFI